MTTNPDARVPVPRKREAVPRVPARAVASTAATVALIFGLVFTVLFTLLVDLVTMPLMRASVPGLVLAGAGAAALALHAALRTAGWRVRTLEAGIAVLLLVLVVPWHPRKRFVFDLFRVEKGMTIEQVEERMAGYPQAPGSHWSLEVAAEAPDEPPWPVTGTLVYGWDESVDHGNVTFVNGRVTRVWFSPD